MHPGVPRHALAPLRQLQRLARKRQHEGLETTVMTQALRASTHSFWCMQQHFTNDVQVQNFAPCGNSGLMQCVVSVQSVLIVRRSTCKLMVLLSVFDLVL